MRRAGNVVGEFARRAAVAPDRRRAAKLMHDLDVGFVPVVDDVRARHLLGVITDRDIAVRCVAKKHGVSCTVGDHMTSTRLDAVHPDDDADDAIALMERDQVRRIPVVTDDNRLEGVIAQSDVALKLGRQQPLVVERILEHISERHER
ncbi:MAG TPA: CBS domain-containing protein [Gemmatimonadaceae bacterium]|nr:CBS domain-containing protein [Gemmatimonadaceae bacterium]